MSGLSNKPSGNCPDRRNIHVHVSSTEGDRFNGVVQDRPITLIHKWFRPTHPCKCCRRLRPGVCARISISMAFPHAPIAHA